MRFRSLGSGSAGNAAVVECPRRNHSPVRLLVDCGFSLVQLQKRLAMAQLCCEDVNAIFITHEHSDHTGCVQALATRHRIPVWMSQGTHEAMGAPALGGLLNLVRDMKAIDLGPFEIRPFTVPHDAREPLQLVCDDTRHRLGFLTDLGHVTAHVAQQLQGCHALLLECNHDANLLAASRYPEFLKRRIAGKHGHLSNAQAAEFVRGLPATGLHTLVAAHLSERNNRQGLVLESLRAALPDAACAIHVSDARSGCDWMPLAV